MITYEDFAKIELRIAQVTAAERVEGSEKLLKLSVVVEGESRQIIAGIGKAYEPETLVGKKIVVVVNLQPRTLMGLESQGMLLAASGVDGPVLLVPEKEVPAGTGIK